MPGGLASWLDDSNGQPHVRRRDDACSADRMASVSVIDEAAPSSTSSTRGQGPVPGSAEREAWDPFGSDCREDAFTRLLSAATRPAGSSTTPASTSQPAAAPASSSWDPFASTGDGKENRGNALSKLLASPSQPNGSSKGKSGPSSAKRKRPAVGSTLLNATTAAGGARAGGAENAEAVTRFCECPVCGKRVLIELCSKHLDTECNGLDATPPAATETAKSPLSAATEGRGAAGPLPPATPPPPALPAVSNQSVLASRPPEEGKGDDGRARTAARVAKGVPRGQGQQPSGDATSAGDDASSARAAASTFPALAESPAFVTAAAAAAAATAAKPAASSRTRKLGRKRGAAAAAMTSCPVCGKQVQADLCSLHLDTDCSGVKPSGGGRKEEVRDEVGSGNGAEADSGKAVPKKDAGSEAAGGLNALAAELTCPICLCVFEDAHSLPCSHRFCLECILGCFKSSKRQECPLCKIPAWKRDLTRDVSIQNIIAAYRRMAA
ncbi:unnamed protein product [Ectocarpus sp. 12 AP-2014]